MVNGDQLTATLKKEIYLEIYLFKTKIYDAPPADFEENFPPYSTVPLNIELEIMSSYGW